MISMPLQYYAVKAFFYLIYDTISLKKSEFIHDESRMILPDYS